jgi:Holliday junction resolvasome RuvABC endonuclease subunit
VKGFLLGVDPGFASIGLAVYELGNPDHVVAMGLITTEKSPKKQEVLASNDNLVRAMEIHREIVRVLKETEDRGGKVVAICAEAMSFPRNASAASKVSLTWGVLASLSEARSIPIIQASPQAVKLKVCGSKTATKEEVEEALVKQYPYLPDLVALPKTKREHVYDALAVVLTCLNHPTIQAVRMFSIQETKK